MIGLDHGLHFPYEVSFQPSEFTGLTKEEPHSLFQRKDTPGRPSRPAAV